MMSRFEIITPINQPQYHQHQRSFILAWSGPAAPLDGDGLKNVLKGGFITEVRKGMRYVKLGPGWWTIHTAPE
jgi:hypothetical protein